MAVYRTEIPMVVNQLMGMDAVMVMLQRRKATRGHKYDICTPEGYTMMKAKPVYTASCMAGSVEVPFNDGQELQIMRMVVTKRGFHRFKMEVHMGGRRVAAVEITSTFRFVLYVYDGNQVPVFRVKRKSTLEYELQSLQKQKIGTIQIRWRGFRKEIFSTKRYIDIRFPGDLAVEFKAVVIAITVYIDILQEQTDD